MNDTVEYLFFTETIAIKFIALLNELKIEYLQESEPVQGGIVIKIQEPEDDELWDSLDETYDEMNSEDQALLEEGIEDEQSKSTAGIYLQLAGGQQTIAQVNPDIMNRMLTVISMDELNTFVEDIVRSVENPDDSPICQC